MAEPPTLHKLSSAVSNLASLPVSLLRYTSSEPLLLGPLLYILTRGPAHIRERLLAPLRSNLLAKDAKNRLEKATLLVKVLLVRAVLQRLSQIMERLALRMWTLPGRGSGAAWKWDGKTEVVVITGGCSGFGYEMVRRFAGKAKVVVLDVSSMPKELEALPEVHYYRCDLTDFDAISSTAAAIRNKHGSPTVLINNAGVASAGLLLEVSNSAIDAVTRVNLSSHMVLIREFLPGMLEAKKGHIVAISSMAAFTSVPQMVPYCATKVAVLALHEGLRNELLARYENGRSIATTCVHPSWHSTSMVQPFESHLAKQGIFADPPSNVAEAVVDQVLKNRSGQIFMPRSQERSTGLRKLPVWMRDVVIFGLGEKMKLQE